MYVENVILLAKCGDIIVRYDIIIGILRVTRTKRFFFDKISRQKTSSNYYELSIYYKFLLIIFFVFQQGSTC